MPVRLIFGGVSAAASVALAVYIIFWRQESATMWSWAACLGLLMAALAALSSGRR